MCRRRPRPPEKPSSLTEIDELFYVPPPDPGLVFFAKRIPSLRSRLSPPKKIPFGAGAGKYANDGKLGVPNEGFYIEPLVIGKRCTRGILPVSCDSFSVRKMAEHTMKGSRRKGKDLSLKRVVRANRKCLSSGMIFYYLTCEADDDAFYEVKSLYSPLWGPVTLLCRPAVYWEED